MIEDWIDKVQDVWASIDAPGGKSVLAPYSLGGDGYPSAVNPSDIERNPIALSFPAVDTQFEYSLGGPLLGFHRGTTYIHVHPNGDYSAVPGLLVWRGLIVQAAAAHMKLYNTVELFVLDDVPDQIVGPVEMAYGNEAWHWTYIVRWKVKERVSFTVSL